jgi:hypothetical protein
VGFDRDLGSWSALQFSDSSLEPSQLGFQAFDPQFSGSRIMALLHAVSKGSD